MEVGEVSGVGPALCIVGDVSWSMEVRLFCLPSNWWGHCLVTVYVRTFSVYLHSLIVLRNLEPRGCKDDRIEGMYISYVGMCM